MAAALMHHALREHQLDNTFTVSSAGVAAATGVPAARHAQKVMAQRKLDLSRHASQSLPEAGVHEMWAIVTMTHEQKAAVIAMYPEVAERVYTLGEFAGEKYGTEWEVADPFGQDKTSYEKVVQQLHEAIQHVISQLKQDVLRVRGEK